ncbi:MAG TPA: hypothetical protein VI318_13650 [Baekduia sp.]
MNLLRFLYDFVVGDDPLLFATAAAGVAATWLIGASVWWLLPLVVCVGLVWSVRRTL